MVENQPLLQAPAAAPPTHPLAITSLVTAILGVTTCVGIGAAMGLVTGYLARNEIRNKPGAYSGDGLATAGMVLGGIGLVYFVLIFAWIFLWFAFVFAMSVLSAWSTTIPAG
jgi:hypothetical protein